MITRICRENCKYVLDGNFHGHFCPRRKAVKFCHPDDDDKDDNGDDNNDEMMTITIKMTMLLINLARMMKSLVVESVTALAISSTWPQPWLLGRHREAILICILVPSLQLKMARMRMMNHH